MAAPSIDQKQAKYTTSFDEILQIYTQIFEFLQNQDTVLHNSSMRAKSLNTKLEIPDEILCLLRYMIYHCQY